GARSPVVVVAGGGSDAALDLAPAGVVGTAELGQGAVLVLVVTQGQHHCRVELGQQPGGGAQWQALADPWPRWKLRLAGSQAMSPAAAITWEGPVVGRRAAQRLQVARLRAGPAGR